MKILTIEWVEDGVECKYVAPVDEGIEEKLRDWKFDITNDFSVLVVRNSQTTNYFSIRISACTLVKIGDDVLLDTRKKAEPTPDTSYSLAKSNSVYGIRRADGKVAFYHTDVDVVNREIEAMSKDRTREAYFAWYNVCDVCGLKATISGHDLYEWDDESGRVQSSPGPTRYGCYDHPVESVKIRSSYPVEDPAPKFKRDKPPIGVKPRYLHDEEHMAELEGAIERYLAAGATPKKEWLEELEELKRRCGEDRPDIDYHWNTVIDTLIASGKAQWSDKLPTFRELYDQPKDDRKVICWNCGVTIR